MKSNAAVVTSRKTSPKKKGVPVKGVEAKKRAKRTVASKARRAKQPQLLSPEEIHTIIVEHAEHGERLARSFLNRWRVKMNQGEMKSVVGVALCEAANRFDKSKKVAFKTFFFYHLRGLLIKEIVRLVEEQKITHLFPQPSTPDKRLSELSLADAWPLPVVETRTPESLYQKNQLAKICWDVCGELDQLEQEVVLRLYVFDQSLNIIAKELGYCRCHISRVKSRALSKLSDSLKRRLPDYRSSVLHYDEQEELPSPPTEDAALRPRKYKGGRGRRKADVPSIVPDNVLPFRKAGSEPS